MAKSSRARLRVERRWIAGGLEAEKEGTAGVDAETGIEGRVNSGATAAIEIGQWKVMSLEILCKMQYKQMLDHYKSTPPP